jgi:hypothetical protein
MHTVDFLSQDFFQQLGSGDVGLPEDALGHEVLATALRRSATPLPAGSVIAIEGSWGRGKTDLLARVAAPTFAAEEKERPRGLARAAVWLNPWGYGSADLLTPLVTELGRRVAQQVSMPTEELKRVVGTLVQAGVAFGVKSAASVLPVGGAVLQQATVPVKDLVESFFQPKGEGDDLDAVAAMASRFRQLVVHSLSAAEREHGARLLVCIDDLDRCLPDRQVALLQAVRFLLSAGAPATFVLAIDPTLAREAVRTHYQSHDFNVERYLDKMFDLRVSMRGLDQPTLQRLARQHLARRVVRDVRNESLGEVVEAVLGSSPLELAEGLAEVLSVGGQANPRVLRRIVDRMLVLVMNHPEGESMFAGVAQPSGRLISCWLLICDREPELRRALQRRDIAREWNHIASSFASALRNRTSESEQPLAALHIPPPRLCLSFARIARFMVETHRTNNGPQLAALDDALTAQGL